MSSGLIKVTTRKGSVQYLQEWESEPRRCVQSGGIVLASMDLRNSAWIHTPTTEHVARTLASRAEENALLIIVAACVFGFVVLVINMLVFGFLIKRRRRRRLHRQHRLLHIVADGGGGGSGIGVSSPGNRGLGVGGEVIGLPRALGLTGGGSIDPAHLPGSHFTMTNGMAVLHSAQMASSSGLLSSPGIETKGPNDPRNYTHNSHGLFFHDRSQHHHQQQHQHLHHLQSHQWQSKSGELINDYELQNGKLISEPKSKTSSGTSEDELFCCPIGKSRAKRKRGMLSGESKAS
ncbi:unnamed protein product [Protopolystoma xenopodis]|uniref:Uncharacterized protein n=1 Tax=Protopolystoma xenopodis TaxID=117903 RepID=A0A3S5AHZ4_9PLAT|nr:unnamed protein product [Protopolystoma xenopodis]